MLAFGTRSRTEAAHLPRAGVSWLGGSWVEAGRGDHPWEREAAAGEPEVAEVGARPSSVVHLDDVEGDHDGGSFRPLARTAGAELTGLNWVRLPPGAEAAPPHLHSADEEIFVVLDGAGTLELWPSPQRARSGVAYEERPLRAGDVVSRPASSGIAHGFRAGDGGMTFLAYGTRNAERRLLLPALEQDLLPRARVDRPAGRSRLRRRRAGLNAGEGKARLGLKSACTWDSCACYRARMFGRTPPPRRRRCRG